ncbi:unnamed protein product [Rangifer tarandus platyrhynchus]|uniref:Uncharacterized protein n=3 Tax=Rangifer tarandus platyrhynchus TaxID=3082113 RepID=A0ACB0F8A8_RANTA|nr:unnamed protein product [Rangifer tarandus platyrhynchus]CAI9709295.1 unnamed protein product [Rangifer tarandus platyrhynchus]
MTSFPRALLGLLEGGTVAVPMAAPFYREKNQDPEPKRGSTSPRPAGEHNMRFLISSHFSSRGHGDSGPLPERRAASAPASRPGALGRPAASRPAGAGSTCSASVAPLSLLRSL